jgi:hypothetical protein
MSEIRDEAPLRYYDGDGADPLPVVLDALRESGRATERVEIDDLAGRWSSASAQSRKQGWMSRRSSDAAERLLSGGGPVDGLTGKEDPSRPSARDRCRPLQQALT